MVLFSTVHTKNAAAQHGHERIALLQQHFATTMDAAGLQVPAAAEVTHPACSQCLRIDAITGQQSSPQRRMARTTVHGHDDLRIAVEAGQEPGPLRWKIGSVGKRVEADVAVIEGGRVTLHGPPVAREAVDPARARAGKRRGYLQLGNEAGIAPVDRARMTVAHGCIRCIQICQQRARPVGWNALRNGCGKHRAHQKPCDDHAHIPPLDRSPVSQFSSPATRARRNGRGRTSMQRHLQHRRRIGRRAEGHRASQLADARIAQIHRVRRLPAGMFQLLASRRRSSVFGWPGVAPRSV